MISFSLTELGLPSLRAVYEMTWAEYLIRLDGFRRQDRKELMYWRRAWFNSLIGPHLDPKKLPKTESAYMPIEGEQKVVKKISDKTREKYLNAVKIYQQQVKQNKQKDGG